MKIEAGKRYVRRDGEITSPLVKEGTCLLDGSSGYYYTEDEWFVCASDSTHPADLISEYVEETLKACPLDEIEIYKEKATIHRLSGYKSENNPVNPSHYKQYSVECIDVAEHKPFNIGSALKYLWRAGEKDDIIVDLEKAKWYIEREIKRLKEQK